MISLFDYFCLLFLRKEPNYTMLNISPMKKLLPLFAILLFIFSCQPQDTIGDLKPLDLLKYGVPISINAPDSAVVKKTKIGDWDDITVKKGEYSLQIFVRNAITNDLEKIKAEELALVKEEKVFSKIIKEEERGFIYETAIDSLSNYNFKYIHLQADRVYTFQKGLADNLTQAQAENIYNSVKQQ